MFKVLTTHTIPPLAILGTWISRNSRQLPVQRATSVKKCDELRVFLLQNSTPHFAYRLFFCSATSSCSPQSFTSALRLRDPADKVSSCAAAMKRHDRHAGGKTPEWWDLATRQACFQHISIHFMEPPCCQGLSHLICSWCFFLVLFFSLCSSDVSYIFLSSLYLFMLRKNFQRPNQ